MQLVKLITSRGRVLYAIRTKEAGWFTGPEFLSLISSNRWAGHLEVLAYCTSPDLNYVKEKLKVAKEILAIEKEYIKKIIPSKCSCK